MSVTKKGQTPSSCYLDPSELELFDQNMRGGALDREFNDLSALEIFSKLGWKISTTKTNGSKDVHVSSGGKKPMALRLLEKSKKRKLEEV